MKTCIEETTYAGWFAVDGSQHPERRLSCETNYDAVGRVLSTRSRNSEGSEWGTSYIYDSSGVLLGAKSEEGGEIRSECVYRYDDLGRMRSISWSHAPDNPVTFHYDGNGRKTKVQNSRPEEYKPNCSAGGSPFEAADRAPNLPGGGSARTSYDERGRPIEVEVFDSHGELVSRAVRIYDEQGRIAQERQILDDPLTIIPAESRARALETAGGSAEDLRSQIALLMAGQTGPYSVAYFYDAQGHIKQMIRQMFSRGETINYSYNEKGDLALEITRSSATGAEGPADSGYSETRYPYLYDHAGNWIEKASSSRQSQDGALQSTLKVSRALEYF